MIPVVHFLKHILGRGGHRALGAPCIVVCCWIAFTAQGCALDQAEDFPGSVIDELPLPEIHEPSGITFHPSRGTFFVVDDGGDVCEMHRDGAVLRSRHLRDADLEGVTVDPSTGLLYVAVEGAEEILEVDPEALKVVRSFPLPRVFRGATVMAAGGQGIEDIAFVPNVRSREGGTFFVANQAMSLTLSDDRSAIFEVELPLRSAAGTGDSARLVRMIEPGFIDIAALWYDAADDLLFAVADSDDTLVALTRDGLRRGAWPLPGREQEGFAVDAQGTAYVAQDTGGILRLVIRWPELHLAR